MNSDNQALHLKDCLLKIPMFMQSMSVVMAGEQLAFAAADLLGEQGVAFGEGEGSFQ